MLVSWDIAVGAKQDRPTVCASCQCLQENQSNKGFHYKSTKTGQCNAYYANHTSHRYFAYPWRLTAFTPQFIQVGYIAVRNATLQRAQIRNLTCCTVTRTSVLKRMRPTSSWSKMPSRIVHWPIIPCKHRA